MPALAAIVLADAQGTPVNHTFNPMGLDANGVLWAVDQSQANAVGYWRISIEQKQPAPPKPGESSAGRSYRVKIGLHEPVLETPGDSSASGIMPAPTVAYIPRSIGEYIIPERSALIDRKNLAKMFPLLLSNAQIVAMVETLAIYS
jgi:hypothetical protein